MADVNSPKEFLAEALSYTDKLNEELSELEIKKERKQAAERTLSSLKSSMVREKDGTIGQRRTDIENSFDQELRKIDSDIKDVLSKRGAAKESGIKERIGALKRPVNEEIKNLKKELAAVVKEENLPGICKTVIYHKLFMPTRFSDFVLIIILLAAVLVLPYFLTPLFIKSEVVRYIVIVGIILLFAILYMAIRAATISKNKSGMKKCSEVMKNLRNAKRRKGVIAKEVRADEDETKYDLGSFDEEIVKLTLSKDTVNSNRAEALLQFDTVTREVILREIDDRYEKDIENAERELSEAVSVYDECAARERETEKTVNSIYLQYIGKENLAHDRITAMMEMIEKGEAISITDAVSKISK